MSGFFDDDAILKLAACELLGEFLEAMGLAPADVRVNPTAKFQIPKFRAKKDKAAIYTPAGLERAARFVHSAAIVERANNASIERLKITRGIDDGEAVLISAAAEHAGFFPSPDATPRCGPPSGRARMPRRRAPSKHWNPTWARYGRPRARCFEVEDGG